ncbi:MAG: biotin/lipoyl-binding protein [Candidatus Dormibacter sp.]
MQAPVLKPLPLPGRSWLSGTHLWIVGLGVVGLVLVGLIARDTFLAKPAAAPLRLATATRGTVTSVVSATGSLEPAGRMNVNFRVAGQLTEVDVKVGDKVTTGQVLARIDPSVQQANLSQAQASLAAAQANLVAVRTPLTSAQIAQLQHQLSNAQQNYNDTVTSVNQQNNADAAAVAADCPSSPNCNSDKTKQNSDRVSGQIRINQAAQQITSSRDNLTVQEQVKPNAIASAQAQVASASAQVQAAQLAVNQATLSSPTSGVVTSINGVAGEMVGAGGGTTAQAPGSLAPAPASGTSTAGSSAFMSIDDTSSFVAVMPFAETDTARLQPNQTASLTFDAISGLTISGHLVSVSPSATVVSNVVDYYGTFVLNRTDPRLRTGMTANASVIVAQADNAVRVPNAAVHTTGGTPMVTVYAKGEQVATEVVVGIVGDTSTEIKAGLNEGDQVVLPALRTGTGTTGTGGTNLLRGGGLGGGGGAVRGGGG